MKRFAVELFASLIVFASVASAAADNEVTPESKYSLVQLGTNEYSVQNEIPDVMKFNVYFSVAEDNTYVYRAYSKAVLNWKEVQN